MVRFISLSAAASIISTIYAANVDCKVGGVTVATVDLDTGVCPFTIPQSLPTVFDYSSPEDYEATFYYAIAEGVKFFNDIGSAGRIIDIPAAALYRQAPVSLFEVDSEKQPAANSTSAIRKRLLGKTTLVSRDEKSDFIESLKKIDGKPVEGAGDAFKFEVVDAAPTSSSGSAVGPVTTSPAKSGATATATKVQTTVITVTSCSDNKCTEKTVPATPGVTTATLNGETTIYTTYCPVTEATATSTATKAHTTVITVTSCSDNKCTEKTVPATAGLTTAYINGETTIYTTYCPVSSEATGTAPAPGPVPTSKAPAPGPAPASKSTTVTEVVTKSGSTYTTVHTTVAAESKAPAPAPTTPTVTPTGTVAPAPVPTTQSTKPTGTVAPVSISTYGNGAAKVGSLAAFVLVPLAYML